SGRDWPPLSAAGRSGHSVRCHDRFRYARRKGRRTEGHRHPARARYDGANAREDRRAHCAPHDENPVTSREAILLLEKFRAGQVGRDEVLRAFQAAPTADLGFAQVDLHRSLRKNFPEVIFGSGKTPAQVVAIATRLAQREKCVLITRIGQNHARALRRKLRSFVYHEFARSATYEKKPTPKRAGTIAVVAAGTSHLPVAEEAAVTADIMGNRVERIYDVGVAGLHRLLRRLEQIQGANVVIAVAGM